MKRINLLRLEQDLSDAHLRLQGVVIEQLPWQRCIEKYDRPETLFLLDPPYWETTGYGSEFGMDQYELLTETMSQLKGRAILTINDHPAMRALFDRFSRVSVPIRYSAEHASDEDWNASDEDSFAGIITTLTVIASGDYPPSPQKNIGT
ncbi:DNA adenine methylase [Stenotrophomonas sp. PSU_St99]